MANYNSDPTKVKIVQTAINAQGWQPPLVVDGKVGGKTTAAVIAFQKLHNLTPDGIIGDQTIAATISPTPAAAAAAASGVIGQLQQQIQQLSGQPAPAGTPPPLLSTPVIAMPTAPGAPSMQAPTALPFVNPYAAAPAAAPIQLPSAPIVKTAPLMIGGVAVPVWAGTAAGTVIGFPFGGIFGALIGGALGAAVDLGRSMMGGK